MAELWPCLSAGLPLEPGIAGFQVHVSLKTGDHIETGLADGKIDHSAIDLDLQA